MRGDTSTTTTSSSSMPPDLREEEEGIADPPLSIFSIVTFSWVIPPPPPHLPTSPPPPSFPTPLLLVLLLLLSLLLHFSFPVHHSLVSSDFFPIRANPLSFSSPLHPPANPLPFFFYLPTPPPAFPLAPSAPPQLSPLMTQGVRQVLGPSDLYPLPSAFSAQHLGAQLSALWAKRNPPPEQQQKGGTGAGKHLGGGGGWAGGYWAVCVWPFRWRLALVALLIVAESAQRILPALLLRQLLRFVQDAQDPETRDPAWRGYVLAGLMGLLTLAFALLHHQMWNLAQIVGWNLRVASMSFNPLYSPFPSPLSPPVNINSKLLSLSGGALNHITTGHCITLMSNDVRRLDELPMFIHFLWAVRSAPRLLPLQSSPIL
ncbi:unnamed protein product [Closterium sp. Naga37s-1]|nr:unnamed protein product [Closterium sp. Naga37s-1]